MDFEERYPALYFALSMTSGILLTQGVWIFFFFCFFTKKLSSFIGFFLISILSFYYMQSTSPLGPKTKITGTGYFQIHKIRTLNDTHLEYLGTLQCFLNEETLYRNLKTRIVLSYPLDGNYHHFIQGTLIPYGKKSYKLYLQRSHPDLESFSFASKRFFLKEIIRSYLKKHVSDELVYAFFSSLMTGDVEGIRIGRVFSRCGLSHTLAISGFHYTYLILLLYTLLKPFFSKRSIFLILTFCVSFYFLFIGETPSMSRAWCATMIFFLGYFLKEAPSGLNALGLGLLLSLIENPSNLFHVGLQLSYLATFAIFTYVPYLERVFYPLFPYRSLKQMKKMPFLFKIGAYFSRFLRNLLALNLGIHFVTFFPLLYHFQFFPLVSLIMNLFFPLLMTLSLALLFLTFLLFPLAPLLLKINVFYSKILLNFVFYGMKPLQYEIVWSKGGTSLILLIFLIILGGILLKSIDEKTMHELQW